MDRIHGYVESVTINTIQGWIVNADVPECLERIVCEGAFGSTAVFMPFLPREDVCQAFQLRGRFGFAIPTKAIQSLGSVVNILDRYGGILEQGEQIVLPAYIPPTVHNPTWVFLHIQKTAGTSLRTALSSATLPGETMFLYPNGITGLYHHELNEIPLVQRAALRLVMGHTYFGIADLLPNDAEYVTFLREPEARLRSHYLHHIRAGSALIVDGNPVDTPSVVQNGLTDEFDNLMVRMITGTSVHTLPIGKVDEHLVSRALHYIRTRFRFVGLTEKSEEHYQALCRAIQFEVHPLATENVGQLNQSAEYAPTLDWEKIKWRNRFDRMLYDRVQQEGLCGRDLKT